MQLCGAGTRVIQSGRKRLMSCGVSQMAERVSANARVHVPGIVAAYSRARKSLCCTSASLMQYAGAAPLGRRRPTISVLQSISVPSMFEISPHLLHGAQQIPISAYCNEHFTYGTLPTSTLSSGNAPLLCIQHDPGPLLLHVSAFPVGSQSPFRPSS